MNKSNLESFVINKHAHILFIANPYKKKPNKQQNLCHEFYKTRNEMKRNKCMVRCFMELVGKTFFHYMELDTFMFNVVYTEGVEHAYVTLFDWYQT